jgi:ssDNA-specific exonuclease RecJ
MSQETLARMADTTRSKVDFFMKKFKRLGFIDDDEGELKINNSLLSVVLHE